MTALEKLDNETSADPWEMRTVDRSAALCSLVRSLLSVEAAGPMANLIDHILSHDATYDLTEAPPRRNLRSRTLVVRKDRQNEACDLRMAGPLSVPATATDRPATRCSDRFSPGQRVAMPLADCVELSRFLADPSQSVHRFRVRQDRRRHLHGIINENRCDLTHVTLRTSNPDFSSVRRPQPHTRRLARPILAIARTFAPGRRSRKRPRSAVSVTPRRARNH